MLKKRSGSGSGGRARQACRVYAGGARQGKAMGACRVYVAELLVEAEQGLRKCAYKALKYGIITNVHIKHCIITRNICEVFLLLGALDPTCPYYILLHMQSVIIISCFICNVSLLFTALYISPEPQPPPPCTLKPTDRPQQAHNTGPCIV